MNIVPHDITQNSQVLGTRRGYITFDYDGCFDVPGLPPSLLVASFIGSLAFRITSELFTVNYPLHANISAVKPQMENLQNGSTS